MKVLMISSKIGENNKKGVNRLIFNKNNQSTYKMARMRCTNEGKYNSIQNTKSRVSRKAVVGIGCTRYEQDRNKEYGE